MKTTRALPAGDFDYEATGLGYGAVRRADPRIAAQVHAALGDAKSVLNVGAGAGNYEPADRVVVALEPSAAMRAQRPVGAAPCVIGVAEALPFDDDAFDACMAMVTVHQWPNLAAGLAELRRVARGPVVILTFDGDAFKDYWVSEYVPHRADVEKKRMPDVRAMAAMLGGDVDIQRVPVPFDCSDGFLEAFYGRPEKLLDPAVRAAQSAWAFIGRDVEARFVDELSADLASGRWDERYGHWRKQASYDGPLRLIVGR